VDPFLLSFLSGRRIRIKKKASVWRIFLVFLRIGLVTFGGGWNCIVQIQRQFVEKEGVLTTDEVNDYMNMARSLPGIVICNLALIVGHALGGLAGGLAATLGIATGPMVVLSGVTFLYVDLRDNLWIAAAMNGVRASVAPVILSALGILLKGSFKLPPCILVGIFSFALYYFFHVGSVLIILIGGVCGLLIGEYYARRGGRDDAVS